MRHFWAQNDPFAQTRIFFRKPINKPCSFHSCLSTSQKSKSGINLLTKYWRLKNTEISLAESHSWSDFSENQIFPKHSVFAGCWWTIRTFVLYKFKTKLMTWFSEKVQKSCFWGTLTFFGNCCPMGIFSHIQLCHTQLRPKTMLSFRKN